jgi:hypothetical protein
MKKLKCKICECEFVPEKKEHYVSRDGVKTGFSSLAAGMEADIYDTFDCPQCGCQNIVGDRKRELYMGENIKEETKEPEEDIETAGRVISIDALDKMRTDIEQLRLHKAQYVTSDNKVCIDSKDVFDVIDKYRKQV